MAVTIKVVALDTHLGLEPKPETQVPSKETATLLPSCVNHQLSIPGVPLAWFAAGLDLVATGTNQAYASAATSNCLLLAK